MPQTVVQAHVHTQPINFGVHPMPKARKHVTQLSETTRKRNTGRYKARQNEPKTSDFDEKAPDYFSEQQKGIWEDLVGRVPVGVLKACDTYVIELTVVLTAKLRTEGLKASELGQYRGCLASLGITPADRSRVYVPPAPEKSLLDRILDGDGEEECTSDKPN